MNTMRKRLFFLAALLALALLQVGDCVAALNEDPAAMQCCRSMPCTPANHSQGCCTNMVSAQPNGILPAQHVSLPSPVLATIEYPHVTEILGHAPAPSLMIAAQQHSPPDLYTLHSSFLI